MTPTAAMLLRAWESGAGAPPAARVPALLHLLGAVPAGERTGELTVGQCDARLFALRREVFGATLEAVATCPACQAEVELTLPLGELAPPVREGPAAPLTVRVGRYTVQCRIPCDNDLLAVAGARPEPTLRDLLEQCVLEVSPPGYTDGAGAAGAAAGLPDSVIDTVIEALADADPGAHTELRVRCPCGSEWPGELDIRAVLWADLTDWAGRTLTEVHLLASAYGWSEADILAMSGWRRRWYLEAAGW